MSRFIKLSSPAFCDKCGRLIRAGRLAAFSMSSFTCYKCAKKRGEAEKDPEEDMILQEMTDEEEGQ